MNSLGKLIACCCALIISSCIASAASAGLLFYDGFNYTAGQLLAPTNDTSGSPNPGQLNTTYGVNWRYAGAGGAANDGPSVATGTLTYTGLKAGVGNSVAFDATKIGSARIQVASPAISSGRAYWSGLLRVNDIATLTSGVNGMMLGGLNNATGPGTLPTVVSAVLRIRKDAVNSTYYVGTGMNSGTGTGSGGTNVQFDTTARSAGDTVFVVAAYEFVAGATNDIAYMWINPNPADFGAAVPPAPTLTSAPGPAIADSSASVNSFNLRNVNTVGAPLVQFDELRVGDSWASVTPVSEPCCGALALAGCGLLRRRGGLGRA